MPGRRSARLGTLMVTLLLAAGCGSAQPAPLKATKPEIPADLCATVPEAARAGLIADSDTDQTGNPTAACSLRSPTGAATEVRAVVTWLQTNDEDSANEVWSSQCRAIDRLQYRVQAGFRPAGADQACAGSGKVDGADSATLAAVKGLEIVTVRLSSLPPVGTPAMARAQQMLEGVLSSVTGSS